MSSVHQVHEDDHVFAICGHVQGEDPSRLRTGYVVANTPIDAIDGMRGCGFAVTAITSLADVKRTAQILEMIAHQHPAVEPSEFLDVYPLRKTPYPEDSVFCFSGHVVDASGALKSGFIVASDVEFVIDYLKGFGFVVESATSLADLRRTMADLKEIALGEGEDNSHFVNLKEAA